MEFQSLPYDIQETILFAAIEPRFSSFGGLDAFAFPTIDHSQSIYSTAERQRSILRLVCREWKQCVDIKAHRLLYLWDLEAFSLPRTTLSQTRHVIMALPSPTLLSRIANDLSRYQSPESLQEESLEQSLWRLMIENGRKLGQNLQIDALEVSSRDDDLLQNSELISLISEMKTITHLNLNGKVSIGHLETASSLLKLTHLKLELRSRTTFPIHLDFPELVFLSINLPSLMSMDDGGFTQWSMPQLKHLRLTNQRLHLSTEIAKSFIAPFAAQLISLHCNFSYTVSDSFWTHFPCLEQLRIHYYDAQSVAEPPKSHPISVIILPEIYYLSSLGILDRLCSWIIRCRTIRTLRFDDPWRSFFKNINTRLFLSGDSASIIRGCKDVTSQLLKLSRIGVTVLDSSGTPFTYEVLLELKQDVVEKMKEWHRLKALEGETQMSYFNFLNSPDSDSDSVDYF